MDSGWEIRGRRGATISSTGWIQLFFYTLPGACVRGGWGGGAVKWKRSLDLIFPRSFLEFKLSFHPPPREGTVLLETRVSVDALEYDSKAGKNRGGNFNSSGDHLLHLAESRITDNARKFMAMQIVRWPWRPALKYVSRSRTRKGCAKSSEGKNVRFFPSPPPGLYPPPPSVQTDVVNDPIFHASN